MNECMSSVYRKMGLAVKNREFWVSTVVGLVAAALVAGAIALTVAFAPAVIATAVATALVGIGIGLGLEYFDLPNKAKKWLNDTLP